MKRVQDEAPELSEELEAWVRDNADAQESRYQRIAAAMEALGSERDQWIEAFFERLKTRGFNYDGDRLRKILDDEIPRKPDGPHRVVF